MTVTSTTTMMSKEVTVVHVESLSYTGTTWFNLLLGSHENALGLGPADRPRDARSPKGICRVHGTKCEFWNGFYESYDPEKNFFLQLAEHSGREFIVTNNLSPAGAGKDLLDSGVREKRIRFVRDGRALLASTLRANARDKMTIFEALQKFLVPGMLSQEQKLDALNPDILYCRYEDLLEDKKGSLKRIGDFLGIDYGDAALRYWTFDHHPAAGNAGPISLIRFHQGIEVSDNFHSKAFYEEQYRKAEEDGSFRGDRWKDELGMSQRVLFDLCCGEFNARLGYERDRFDMGEVSEYLGRISELRKDNLVPPVVTEAIDSLSEGSNLSKGVSFSEKIVFARERAMGALFRLTPAGVRSRIPVGAKRLIRKFLLRV